MDIIENEKNVQYFLDLIKKSRRGKFKLYTLLSLSLKIS